MKNFLLGMACFFSGLHLLPAEVTYPFPGNLTWKAGAIEMWFVPLGDLSPEMGDDRFKIIYPLFSVQSEEIQMEVSWVGTRSREGEARYGAAVSISGTVNGAELMSFSAYNAQDALVKGQSHHLTVSWEGKDIKLILDGKLLADRHQLAPWAGPVANATVRFGRERPGCSPILLEAVRLSDVPRSGEDAMERDRGTTLLDVFQEDFSSRNPPRVASGPVGEPDRELTGKEPLTTSPATGLLFNGPAGDSAD